MHDFLDTRGPHLRSALCRRPCFIQPCASSHAAPSMMCKSTLIGRLLFDCGMVHEDQYSALTADTLRYGNTVSGEPDLALLVDGLEAEREQKITLLT